MKCTSIWQPYASLIVHGHKIVETRSWPAPASLIGKTIGIAATKLLRPEQKAIMQDPDFRLYYDETGLPDLSELPRGCVIGTALLHSCDVITNEDMDDVTDEEKAFGWWSEGRYAWRLRYARSFPEPIPARGAQGIWNWDPFVGLEEAEARKDQDWAASGRSHLRLVK